MHAGVIFKGTRNKDRVTETCQSASTPTVNTHANTAHRIHSTESQLWHNGELENVRSMKSSLGRKTVGIRCGAFIRAAW